MKMTIVLYLLNIFIFVFGTSQLVLKIKSNYTRITLVLLVVAIVPLEGDEPDGGESISPQPCMVVLGIIFQCDSSSFNLICSFIGIFSIPLFSSS